MAIIYFLTSLPITVFDPIFLVFLLIFLYLESSAGFFLALFNLLNIATSFFVGLIFYSFLSHIFGTRLYLPKGLADGLSLILLWICTWGGVNLIFNSYKMRAKKIKINRALDILGAFCAGVISFFFLSCLLLTLLISLPSSGDLKTNITKSLFGRFVLLRVVGMESNTHLISGQGSDELLNFLTISPYSEQTVPLNFTSDMVVVDQESEITMTGAINEERRKFNLRSIVLEEDLRVLARSQAEDMLNKGYFAYVSPEGYSLFDRLELAGTVYNFAVPHIAYSPDTEIVIQRFLTNRFTRGDILDSRFKRIGIGVVDSGNFGKIFVLIFVY